MPTADARSGGFARRPTSQALARVVWGMSARARRARLPDSAGRSLRGSVERPVDRLPLAALRPILDERSRATEWLLNPDGVLGRALMIPAGSGLTVALELANEVAFSSRVMLFPHDWRDTTGAVQATVAVTDRDGRCHELWSNAVRADPGRPRGLRVQCSVPGQSTSLSLTVHGRADRRPGRVARAIWVQPAISDPHALPWPAPVATAPSGAAPAPRPSISVLMPVHDPPPAMLEEAIASVVAQTFGGWELCLVDDGSTDPEVVSLLRRHAETDPRIRLACRAAAGGIAVATNAAMELASGDYIALLDHDDTLAPDALERVAGRLAAEPGLDMIYTDEDIVLDGRRVWAHLKPDWSPDTLRTNGYTCHLGVYRRSLVQEIGGFRSEFNGSQDVDMILRLTERTDRIAHIPRILYHWRAHESSTAGAAAKPYAYVAGRKAIAAHLQRIGLDGDVGFGPPGLYRLRHRVDSRLRVDIVLAVATTRGLAEAAASWVAQPHSNWSVVLAAPDSALHPALEILASTGIPDARITAVPAAVEGREAGRRTATSALASAAKAATGEHLVLMQTPSTGLTHDWLSRLIGYGAQAGVGAAGPVVLAGDGRIQQAGIALPEGIPLHLLHGSRSSMDALFGYGTSVYNVSAVSGILATSRDIYEQLGGLDPSYRELALIEYCLRAGDRDLRSVIVPDARLRTAGPDPATNDLPALWRLRGTWARTHIRDDYYNPNYRTDRGDFTPCGDGP